MSVQANDFIANALFLAGLWDPQEEIPRQYTEQGLLVLNDMLQEFSSSDLLVPYVTEFSFSMTPGKSRYTVGPGSGNDIVRQEIVSINEARATIDSATATYPLLIYNYQSYNRSDQDSLSGPPYSIFLFEHNGYGELIFQGIPDQAYLITVMVKQKYLEYVGYESFVDIPTYMLKYARYQLAMDLADVFQHQLSAQVKSQYKILKRRFIATTARDISAKKRISYFQRYNKSYYNGGYY